MKATFLVLFSLLCFSCSSTSTRPQRNVAGQPACMMFGQKVVHQPPASTGFILAANGLGIPDAMDTAQALGACGGNYHLPTARELAKFAQAHGAQVLESSQVDKNHVPNDYYEVTAMNPDKAVDDFYLNFDSYQPPQDQGDLGCLRIWSSSRVPGIGCNYTFDGPTGSVTCESWSNSNSVLCVPN
jgi:hypothetical protein